MFAICCTLLRKWFAPSPAMSEAEPASPYPIPEFLLTHHTPLEGAGEKGGISVPYDENLLERARTQWQFGDWPSLSQLTRDTLQHHPDRAKLALLAAAGRLQTGQDSEAKAYIGLAQDWGVSKKLVSQILIAGVHNSIGRAAAIGNQQHKASEHFKSAIAIGASGVDHRLVTQGRIEHQLRQLSLTPLNYCVNSDNLTNKCLPIKQLNRKLFLDCGAYDGCSAIKFLIENDGYDCISFEPNPDLWHYFSKIPVLLIKKAVSTYDGEIRFIIDPIDADGSSYNENKNVTYGRVIPNSECPTIMAECINLSSFIKQQALIYQDIVLKLDIEGAEYEVLDDLISSDAICSINTLHCEFHWSKIRLTESDHNAFVSKLKKHVKLVDKEWDALDFSIHQNSSNKTINLRKALIAALTNRQSIGASN